MTVGTNYLGPFLLTHLLLPVLESTAADGSDVRIVHVASIGSTTIPTATSVDLLLAGMKEDGKPYGYFPAYAASKLAQVMMAVEMDRRFGPNANRKVAIKSFSLHPGGIHTQIWVKNTPHPVSSAIVTAIASLTWKTWVPGAQPALDACFAPDAVSGAFLVDFQPHPVAPIAIDPVRCEELYVKSKKLVGLE